MNAGHVMVLVDSLGQELLRDPSVVHTVILEFLNAAGTAVVTRWHLHCPKKQTVGLRRDCAALAVGSTVRRLLAKAASPPPRCAPDTSSLYTDTRETGFGIFLPSEVMAGCCSSVLKRHHLSGPG